MSKVLTVLHVKRCEFHSLLWTGLNCHMYCYVIIRMIFKKLSTYSLTHILWTLLLRKWLLFSLWKYTFIRISPPLERFVLQRSIVNLCSVIDDSCHECDGVLMNISCVQGIYKGVGSLKHRACPFAVTVQWNLIQEMPLIFWNCC